MIFKDLYKKAPPFKVDISHVPDYEDYGLVVYIGEYSTEFSSYYIFYDSTEYEFIYIDKIAPFDYFNGNIPENYEEIMRKEQPWMFEDMVVLECPLDKYIDYLKRFYIHLSIEDNLDKDSIKNVLQIKDLIKS